MGTIILIVALIAESAFAAFCIVTKSNQNKVRGIVRLGAFAAFILLSFVSIIQWGARWYLLAALLLVWAALGAWTLIRKPAEKKGYGVGRAVVTAIGTFGLVLVAMIPALIFPQYTPPKITGTHAVATVNYTYTDHNRVETFTNTGESRKVNVEFWYPKDGGGPYPLVVFDHGILGLKTSNTSTFMELASNGYIVCSIDHPYLSLFTVDDSGRMTRMDNAYLQEYMDASNGKFDDATSTRLEQKWISYRVADIHLVLNTIVGNAKETGSGAVYRMIDPGKIGLMGHSLGGESSAQVARERGDIRAVVNLDADLAGEYVGYVNGKSVLNDKPYPVPILTIFSDTLERLIDAVPDANTVVAVKHITATAPNAYEIHLTGTDHLSLTDVPLSMPFLVSVINASVPRAGGQEEDPLSTIEKMNDIVLKFFNAYLKGQGNFAAAGAN